jgi:arylsulfatase A-like enzyme
MRHSIPAGGTRTKRTGFSPWCRASSGGTLSWLAADGTDEEQTDGKVAGVAIDLLKKYKEGGDPFFLAVGFYKPHTPYVAPKKYFEMYDKSQVVVPKVPEGYWDTIPEPAAQSLRKTKNQINLPEDTARSAIHAYYATFSFLDAQVGRVLDALESLGLRDNTVVLFTSDHGYHMGEHGHYQKMTLFEDAGRVPLILRYPGMSTMGRRTQALAEMVDFYRTLSELAGLPEPPPYVQGKSLAPVLRDPAARVRDSALTLLPTQGVGYALRTERYRFTLWGGGGPDLIKLYDHASDPAEMRNLARNPEHAELVRQLEAQIRARVAQTRAVPAGLKVLEETSGARRTGGKKGQGKSRERAAH